MTESDSRSFTVIHQPRPRPSSALGTDLEADIADEQLLADLLAPHNRDLSGP